MDVDEPPSNQSEVNVSPDRFASFLLILFGFYVDFYCYQTSSCRLLNYRVEAFDTILGQHMRANHLDVISIIDIDRIINAEAATNYSRAEIMFLLEVTNKT